MIHKNKPKFGKGIAVKFEGANNLKAIKQTYVHAVATEDEINYFYLIEHPQGIVLCEQTEYKFQGFDTLKLKQGLKYVVAGETELEAIIQQTEIQNPQEQLGEQEGIDPQEQISITLPRCQWEATLGAIQTTIASLQQNKMLVLMQPDMTETIFNDIIANTKAAESNIIASGI